jgi:hypothetical protein
MSTRLFRLIAILMTLICFAYRSYGDDDDGDFTVSGSTFAVSPGAEAGPVQVPFEPPPPPRKPELRAPTGEERPWPGEPERPDEIHAPENEVPGAEEPEKVEVP